MQVVSKILIVLSVLFGGLFVLAPTTAFADDTKCTYVVTEEGKWKSEDGKTEQDEAPAACKAASDSMVGKILRFVNVLSALVIVFAVGMIVYAGFKYITSQGDPKAVESAKQQLWYSGVGLFIVLTAFTILQLFKNASGQ